MGTPIAEPLTLKCGIRLENRLVKAAMTEQMSDENYLPTEIYNRAYGKWAEGQWGMVILGMPFILLLLFHHYERTEKLTTRGVKKQATSSSTRHISAARATQPSTLPTKQKSFAGGRPGPRRVPLTRRQRSCRSTIQASNHP